ncbi:MAG: DUF3179 domain-containing protein [bacterium]|nr:DUF3179 domain-containing protein [bacterium]
MASTRAHSLILIALVGAVLSLAGCGQRDAPLSEGFNGFDLSSCVVNTAVIVKTGLTRTGMLALTRPEMLEATDIEELNQAQRGKLLVPSDRVVGLVIGDEARAYPLRLLRWHEVVNDEIDGRPFAVSYSGPSDAAVVFDRRLGAESVAEFAASGLLYNSNLLLYDLEEGESLWSQLLAEAISGPAVGIKLRVLRSEVVSWGDWLGRYPETRVLAPDERYAKRYRRDPYHSYFGSDLLHFPVAPLPDAEGLHLKDRVLSVDSGYSRALYSLPGLVSQQGSNSGELEVSIGVVPVRLRYNLEEATLSAEPIEIGRPLDTRFACWFAWHATHPNDVIAETSAKPFGE